MSKVRFIPEDVLAFHEEMEKIFAMEKGVRDVGLLESAVNAPFQDYFGVARYPSVPEKAARLCFGIAKNHPFFDGNKRTALHSMLVYLAVCGLKLDADDAVLEKLIIDVASGAMSLDALTAWIETHSKEERR